MTTSLSDVNVKVYSEEFASFVLDTLVNKFSELVKSQLMDKKGQFHNAEAEEMYAYFSKAVAEVRYSLQNGESTVAFADMKTLPAIKKMRKMMQDAEEELLDEENELSDVDNMEGHFISMGTPLPYLVHSINERLDLVEAMIKVLHEMIEDNNKET